MCRSKSELLADNNPTLSEKKGTDRGNDCDAPFSYVLEVWRHCKCLRAAIIRSYSKFDQPQFRIDFIKVRPNYGLRRMKITLAC